jgi:hypothetical protein
MKKKLDIGISLVLWYKQFREVWINHSFLKLLYAK